MPILIAAGIALVIAIATGSRVGWTTDNKRFDTKP